MIYRGKNEYYEWFLLFNNANVLDKVSMKTSGIAIEEWYKALWRHLLVYMPLFGASGKLAWIMELGEL